MTPEQNVDLDRLADYAAGALESAEAAEVSRLIATRSDWADAYLALVAADTQIRARLREYSRTQIEPMPADVIARLDEALARPPVAGRWAAEPNASGVTSLGLARARRASRRATMRRLTAVAATVVALAGGLYGLGSLMTTATENRSTTGSGGAAYQEGTADQNSAPGGGPPPQAPSGTAGPVRLATGIDYQAETLALVAANALIVRGSVDGASKSAAPGVAPGSKAEFPLLMDSQSLTACLDAVTRTHPGTVQVIDYARYQGEPALIVLIRDNPGPGGVVVVVGPECSATDTRERVAQRLP